MAENQNDDHIKSVVVEVVEFARDLSLSHFWGRSERPHTHTKTHRQTHSAN